MPGFYYRVQRGDTLYRIAKTYGIELDLLASINRIADTKRIETGSRLFIPRDALLMKKSYPSETKANSNSLAKTNFVWPIKGRVISYFNQRTNNILNKGIDIKTDSGGDVVSSSDGEVWFCGELLKGYGKTIIIKHDEGLSTTYSRLLDVFVKAGDSVTKGQIIAKVGIVGRDDTPYLHFEVRDGSETKNPFYYLP